MGAVLQRPGICGHSVGIHIPEGGPYFADEGCREMLQGCCRQRGVMEYKGRPDRNNGFVGRGPFGFDYGHTSCGGVQTGVSDTVLSRDINGERCDP